MMLCPAEPTWFPAIATTVVAVGLSYGLGQLIKRIKVVDAPDGDRKTQLAPVPRLGGLAIFGAFILTAIVLLNGSLFGTCYSTTGFLNDTMSTSPFSLVFPLVAIFAFLVGLLDDIISLSSRTKLSLLFLACFAPLLIYGAPIVFTTPWGDLSSPTLMIIGSGLWLLVFTNATNFMDGSNGLSVGCIGIMLAGLISAPIEFSGWSSCGYTQELIYQLGVFAFIGAIIGFLIHNLGGKLYAGDAGALGLGALFASLGLVSGLEVWTVATLALPFLVDVLMTLIWRAKHKRSWLEAHLDHAYQRLRKNGWSHLETAILYWGLTATCAAAAVIAAKAGGEAPFIVFWTLCLAGVALWTAHRRSQSADELQ
ncbi:MAG: hypothetical protein ABNH53_13780 [Henriciella sp.]|jgi:UDP-N-acetylmuramyl pentapeptide phosphotransferase/UDP-N-acetylglucosamine-1-phosphate transferase